MKTNTHLVFFQPKKPITIRRNQDKMKKSNDRNSTLNFYKVPSTIFDTSDIMAHSIDKKNFAKKLGKKDKGRLEALKVYDQYIDKKKLEKIIGEIIDVEPEKKKKKKTATTTTSDDGWVFTLNPFKIVDTILQSCFFQYRLWRNT